MKYLTGTVTNRMLDAKPVASTWGSEDFDDKAQSAWGSFELTTIYIDSNNVVSTINDKGYQKYCLGTSSNQWGTVGASFQYYYGEFYEPSGNCYYRDSMPDVFGCPSYSSYAKGSFRELVYGGERTYDYFAVAIYRNETIIESMCSSPNKTWYK